VLSTLSLLVIAGSVGWAEATDAQPHAAAAESADAVDAEAGDPAVTGTSFQICATGDYPVYVTLPDDGNAKSATAQPKACVTQVLKTEGEHSVKIFGLEDTTPFEIGDDEVAAGEKLTATGTVESPDYSIE
jgi:hypothetical protein